MKPIRIGNGCGFWGDSAAGPAQLVRGGDLDFLVLDYLSEITLSLLARARRRRPELGYTTDFVTNVMRPLAAEIAARRIRVVANAGGVTASYFEWAQARQGYAWDEELVATRLHRTMERAFDATWQQATSLGVPLRRAAIALGVGRVAEATRVRGLFP